jgi:hypothetical protein
VHSGAAAAAGVLISLLMSLLMLDLAGNAKDCVQHPTRFAVQNDQLMILWSSPMVAASKLLLL